MKISHVNIVQVSVENVSSQQGNNLLSQRQNWSNAYFQKRQQVLKRHHQLSRYKYRESDVSNCFAFMVNMSKCQVVVSGYFMPESIS